MITNKYTKIGIFFLGSMLFSSTCLAIQVTVPREQNVYEYYIYCKSKQCQAEAKERRERLYTEYSHLFGKKKQENGFVLDEFSYLKKKKEASVDSDESEFAGVYGDDHYETKEAEWEECAKENATKAKTATTRSAIDEFIKKASYCELQADRLDRRDWWVRRRGGSPRFMYRSPDKISYKAERVPGTIDNPRHRQNFRKEVLRWREMKDRSKTERNDVVLRDSRRFRPTSFK